MIYILLLLLILLSLFYYMLFCKDILSPSFIATLMFTISTFVASLNAKKWGFSFDGFSLIVVITTLLSIGLGEVVARLNFERIGTKLKPVEHELYIIRKRNLIILFLFFLIGFLGYLYSTIEMAKLLGWRGGRHLIDCAHYVRNHPEKYGVPFIERFFSWWKNFCKIFVYILSFFFLYNLILKNKITWIYLVFILFYFGLIVLSGGRMDLIYLFLSWGVVGICFFMQKGNWNPKYNVCIVKICLIAVLVFFCLFLLAGNLRSQKSFGRIWRVISLYVGESIPLLDKYFSFPKSDDSWFGENTLFGVYRFLRKFNKSIPYFYGPYEFTAFSNGESGNLYTIIRRYHEDFGFVGLYLLSSFLGFFYTFFLLKVRNKQNWSLLLYSMCIAPIFEVSIDDILFLSIVDVGYIAILFITVFLYNLMSGTYNKYVKMLFSFQKYDS